MIINPNAPMDNFQSGWQRQELLLFTETSFTMYAHMEVLVSIQNATPTTHRL